MNGLKKIMASCLSLGMIASLVGCASSEPTENNEAPKEEKKEEVKQESSSGKVESISLDNSEGTLKYTGFELSTDYDGNNAIIVYYDYTNKKEETSYVYETFYAQAFQNGVECETTWLNYDGQNESLDNNAKEIQKGTTINVGFMYVLSDTENPVTIKVSDQSEENLFDDIYQEQEIAIK